MDTILLYSVPAIAILGLIIMAIQGAWVRKQDAGESKMAEIAQHIHEGALAFLNAEYRILAIFVVVAGALLGFVSSIVETTEIYIVAAFVIGAVFSALAGNIGMRIATQANVRTTQAARTGIAHALKWRSGQPAGPTLVRTNSTVAAMTIAGLVDAESCIYAEFDYKAWPASLGESRLATAVAREWRAARVPRLEAAALSSLLP